MAKRYISALCVIILLTPGIILYAQDETSPEKKPEKSNIIDSAPAKGTAVEGSKIDSLGSIEALPESLVTVPVLPPPITPTPQLVDDVREYGFKGTGRDIIIGAAVLTGWIFVAFLAANQKSD